MMLQMLAGGQAPSAASLGERLSQIAQQDPRLAPLVQQMQERLANPPARPEPEPEVEESAESAPDGIDCARLLRRNEKLTSIAREIFEEVQTLRARNDMLASALGACHLCWGDDPECPYCTGAGRVGAYLINPKQFDQVIGPAVKQLKERPKLVEPQQIHRGGDHAI